MPRVMFDLDPVTCSVLEEMRRDTGEDGINGVMSEALKIYKEIIAAAKQDKDVFIGKVGGGFSVMVLPKLALLRG